jgi:hypothetical protein
LINRVRAFDDFIALQRREAVEEYQRNAELGLEKMRHKLRTTMSENAIKATEEERKILEWQLESSRWTKDTAAKQH